MHTRINTKYGQIEFNAEGMAGCCGVSVIFDVYFRQVKDKVKLYDYFLNKVIFGKDDINGGGWDDSIVRDDDLWNVNKFLLTDRLPPKGDVGATLYEFCHTVGAHYGTVTHNPNSGHRVQAFELTRPKGAYTINNGKYYAQTGGIQTPAKTST